LVDDKFKQCERCEALHVLGLGLDALEPEIRKAHRALAELSRPERFQDNEELKNSAADKLQDINSAFEFLTATSTERGQLQRPKYLSISTQPSSTASQNAPAKVEAAATVASADNATPLAIPKPIPLRQHWQKAKVIYKRTRLFLRIAAVLVVLLTGESIWTFLRANHSDQVASVSDQPSNSKPSDSPAVQSAPPNVSNPRPIKIPAAPEQILTYITVGTTKAEVLAQQGPPTSSSQNLLIYGRSSLYFKDDRVIGWRIDTASTPIRVKLWPHSYVDPKQAHYSIGSSKDEVLAVQGTPTAFTEDRFEYGDSVVYFRNDKVVSWKEDPKSTPLWIQ